MFYLVLRKFVVGFGKRKHNREVKPQTLQINNFTSKEILVDFLLKLALIYLAFSQEMLIFGLLKFKNYEFQGVCYVCYTYKPT
jgi:hypothetical protein